MDLRHGVLERKDNGAATRTQIEHVAQVVAIDQGQGLLHQDLSVRARDQGVRRDLQGEIPKLALTQDIGHGHALEALSEQGAKYGFIESTEFLKIAGDELHLIELSDMHHQKLRIKPRA